VSRSAAPSVPNQPRITLRSRRTFSDISPVLLLAPDAMFPAGAQCFWPLEPSSPKYSHLCLRRRRPAPPRRTIPAQQNSRDMSGISVSVKSIMRRLLRVTETARELKSSAWPDVGEASEGHLPQHHLHAPPQLVVRRGIGPSLLPLCFPPLPARRRALKCRRVPPLLARPPPVRPHLFPMREERRKD
jgi:hypothetical protein